MQNKTHTPGPWEWWTSNSFLRLSSKATGKDGDVIDSFKMSDGHTSLSVKHEDMALIASAPDLLAALQDFMSASSGNTQSCGHDFECICRFDKAKAAIAKALRK